MLKIKDLNFSIGKNNILKEIELNIEKKEFIGIIGENGCGKSTLLKNIYRIHKPEKNCVFLNEKEINEYSVKDLAKNLAVLSQNQKVSFDFTVKEIVEMGLYAKSSSLSKKEIRERIDNSLEEVGMFGFKDKSFLVLSGGEMQRVLIARAIAQETDILILDEPTNHLDIRYQYQIMDLVKKLDKTVIAVIHDVNIASRYCDYIVAIKNGKIIYKGTPKEVLTKERVKDIFDIDVEVIEHPYNKKPLIIYL